MRSMLVLILLSLALPATAGAQGKREIGYIALPDGVQLKYTLLLPEGEGPFPTLMQYEGYQAGSAPGRATHKNFVPNLLKKGYALIGVSLRGSACSGGAPWDLFGEQQARDGAFAVEWAARQPWSNGRVGMYGYSYGGIMQLWVAAMRPKGLVAATPSNVVADTYRDIGFPGGVWNNIFPPEWGVALQADWAQAAQTAAQDNDTTCLANIATNFALAPQNSLAAQIVDHPLDDQWHRDHSPVNFAQHIDVPILTVRTWQDEETGGRQASFWERLDPERTWQVNSPGNHLVYQFSDALLPTLEGFFDRFVKGERNGFERTPHVQIWHETGLDSNPRTMTTQDRLPVQVAEAALYLGDGGVLTGAAGADGTTAYPYPVESPAVVDTASQGLQTTLRENTWSHMPYLALGRAVYTTPPLKRTVTTYGPSSADLWVSTSAPDVDLQVTITEVRPDGQEVWIQRGWLRASHRALDAARSTALSPYHPHTPESLADMPAGEPQLLRVDVFPFGHTFRTGSSLRMYVEQPSVTGLWGFDHVKTPQTVTIHHGKEHPSRLMLGLLRKAEVAPDLPACDQLLNTGCRPNPVAQPGGELDLVPAPSTEPAKFVEPRVEARFYGRRYARRKGVLLKLRGRPAKVTVELRRGRRLVARARSVRVNRRLRSVVLKGRFRTGAYTLVIRSGKQVLLRRAVRLGR